MNNAQIEITNWLNSERNYADGVYLFDKYGRNPQLKRLFPGRGAWYAEKLAYELGKLIGLGFSAADEKGVELVVPEKTSLEKSGAGGDDERLNDVVSSVGEYAEQAREYAEQAEENAGRTDESAERAEESALKAENVAETLGALASGGVVDNPAYPTVINRVIAEYSRLYNERGILKRQQNAVPDENTAENVEKRRVLIEQIDVLSGRMDVLYKVKTAYLEGGELPDERSVFPVAGESNLEGLSREKLTQLRNNLRSQITRANNMLNYQSQKKEKKMNPMPPCPKRKELESRIREKECELAALDERLKDAD